jgi:hypothetical protein
MKPVLLVLFIACLPLFLIGQENYLLQEYRFVPSDQQWTELRQRSNSIPRSELEIMEQQLDSTISAADAYGFLHNEDSTKFLSLFLMRKDDDKLKRLNRFGRIVERYHPPSASDSVEYLGYQVWGMYYDQNWYYLKTKETEFWDTSLKSAKDNFLFYSLSEVEFLSRKNEERFWRNGGNTDLFKAPSKRNVVENEGSELPELIVRQMRGQDFRRKTILNDQLENQVCAMVDQIWTELHQTDSLNYHSRYRSIHSGRTCFLLYNTERSKVLLPVIHYDAFAQAWLRYFYLDKTDSGWTLHEWTLFPPKKLESASKDLSIHVVYDLRTLMDRWNWGTVNVIGNDSFWNSHFSQEDLKLIKHHSP